MRSMTSTTTDTITPAAASPRHGVRVVQIFEIRFLRESAARLASMPVVATRVMRRMLMGRVSCRVL